MSKKQSYLEHLTYLFEAFLQAGSYENLKTFLISNSNLPGPRGNLELAEAFAIVVETLHTDPEKLWDFCMKLTSYSVDEAPINSPAEFLVFCGTRGIGVFLYASGYFPKALCRLKELASDERWRTRESVAMAIQGMIAKEPTKTLEALNEWIEKDNWLVMRAAAAGVAEPFLLKNKSIAKSALALHKKIFNQILLSKDRGPRFKVLRQGLGYSFSVVAHELPSDCFDYMRELVKTKDADILWIVKENLKKNRLTKNFPDEVNSIKLLID